MDFTPVLKNITDFIPSGPFSKKSQHSQTLFILSAHPDDECIQGGVALRLMHENHFHVVNIAVTLGSNEKRQNARIKELANATSELEFENIILSDDWKKKEKELASLILKYQPSFIICHHDEDHHPTHIKTAKLLKKVCTSHEFKNEFWILWNEFWGIMKSPKMLIEIPYDLLEKQMTALLHHEGEIKRNPYHLRLPSWMVDNVRRGSEIVAGKGSTSPQFAFGVLLDTAYCKKKKIIPKKNLPSIISRTDDLYLSFEAASRSKTSKKSK